MQGTLSYSTDMDDMDRHSRDRDRKLAKRERSRRMRGNRSVFEIEKAVENRARKLRDKGRKHNA